MNQSDNIAFMDEILKNISSHLTVNSGKFSKTNIDGGSVYRMWSFLHFIIITRSVFRACINFFWKFLKIFTFNWNIQQDFVILHPNHLRICTSSYQFVNRQILRCTIHLLRNQMMASKLMRNIKVFKCYKFIIWG